MKQIKGNLLAEFYSCHLDAIGTCCNCHKNFGAGIAKQIKQEFPEAYKADCDWNQPPHHRLGKATHAKINLVDRIGYIFNLYGQLNYGKGRQVNYEALYTSLCEMKKELSILLPNQVIKVGFPKKMASDLAGGSWRIVEKMIEVVFDSPEFEVTIVEFDV